MVCILMRYYAVDDKNSIVFTDTVAESMSNDVDSVGNDFAVAGIDITAVTATATATAKKMHFQNIEAEFAANIFQIENYS